MRIALAADRARFEQKQRLELFLIETGHLVEDFGVDGKAVFSAEGIRPLAEAVAQNDFDRGILLGETGSGEAVTANRVPGVRCAVCWNPKSARLTRQRLDANVLALGLDLMSYERARSIVEVWLETPCSRRRHARIVKSLEQTPLHHHERSSNEMLPHRAPMLDETSYICSVCGQEFNIPIDLSAGSSQEYVEDCPVCCHSHEIHVAIDKDGNVLVAGKGDEGYF